MHKCQGTSCSKQTQYPKFKWLQQELTSNNWAYPVDNGPKLALAHPNSSLKNPQNSTEPSGSQLMSLYYNTN